MLIRQISKRIRPFINQRKINFKLERPLVSFTFDDFPRTAITNGARMLEAEGWRSTYYTSAALEKMVNHHGPHFNKSDLHTLNRKGHEIACHTLNHIDMSPLSSEEIVFQCEQNKQELVQSGISHPLENFAYPFGIVSPRLKKTLQPRYRSMRGIQRGVHFDKADLNELKANPLDQPKRLKQAHALLETLGQKPGWIIFFAHEVTENPSEWGCTPEAFQAIINSVKNIDALVLPVNEAIDYLEARRRL